MFTFRSGDPIALVVHQAAHLGEVAVPLDQPVQHGGLAEEGVLTYTPNLDTAVINVNISFLSSKTSKYASLI